LQKGKGLTIRDISFVKKQKLSQEKIKAFAYKVKV
jgi:hypothetical protein